MRAPALLEHLDEPHAGAPAFKIGIVGDAEGAVTPRTS
jgi:hypothetical protein